MEPGDILVLKTHLHLTGEQTKNIEALMKDKLGHEVIVLAHGFDIGVLRQAA